MLVRPLAGIATAASILAPVRRINAYQPSSFKGMTPAHVHEVAGARATVAAAIDAFSPASPKSTMMATARRLRTRAHEMAGVVGNGARSVPRRAVEVAVAESVPVRKADQLARALGVRRSRVFGEL